MPGQDGIQFWDTFNRIKGGMIMKDKPIYTEQVHAGRLLEMLEADNPCGCCPANKDFLTGSDPQRFWHTGVSPCHTCRSFVGAGGQPFCPCGFFDDGDGDGRTFKVTWLALEEKGYLD